MLKEHYINDWGKRFQAENIATLIYDHRSWGSSEGTPRNAVSPLQQAEDYHDAVLFLTSVPEIDASRIGIWGIGHSGGASIIAGGSDPNIKLVVAVMPFLSGRLDASSFPAGMLERAWHERKAIASGSKAPTDLEYVQPWNNSENEAAGERGEVLLHGKEPYGFIRGAVAMSDKEGTPHQNRLTLQSVYDITRIEPIDFIYKISPKPLLHLAATEDPLSGPLELQKKAFELAREPKEFVLLEDNHLQNYSRNFEQTIGAQIAFLKKHL